MDEPKFPLKVQVKPAMTMCSFLIGESLRGSQDSVSDQADSSEESCLFWRSTVVVLALVASWPKS